MTPNSWTPIIGGLFMYKHKKEFKIKIAQRYLAGETSNRLASAFNINRSLIKYWARVYSIHKLASFSDGHACITAKEKLSALRLMWTNQWSISHTSAVLNLSSPGILSTWRKRYSLLGIDGLHSKPRGRPRMKLNPTSQAPKSDDNKSIEELREELAYLRAENAVLKKLEELEQQKRRQIKKKR